MRKTFSILLILLIFINLYCPVSGQSLNIQFDQESTLNTLVEPNSVNNPYSLQQWTPSAAEPSYLPNPKGKNNSANTIIEDNSVTTTLDIPADNKTVSSSGSNARTLGIVLGTSIPVGVYTGVLTFLLLRKGSSVSLPPIAGSKNLPLPTNNSTPFNTNHSFKFGEEILYYLVLKNTPKTPIYDDTVVYIKLPSWLSYQTDSTVLNNNKLTDKTDNDVLNYFDDESLLLLNLGSLKNNDRFLINFTAKVLTQNVSVEEAFCQIKVQSIKHNYESEWFEMTLLPDTVIPKSVENVILGK